MRYRFSLGLKFVLANLFVHLIGIGLAVAQSPVDRWAVVIGNGEYTHEAVSGLENTVNDARTMAASLTNMGFKVFHLENATGDDVDQVVEAISTDHANANLGLFFFAGHGLQQDGINYALPSDIDPSLPNFLQEQGISLSSLVRDLENTGIEKLVVILDSCRNSPFGDDQAFGAGLALVDAPDNTIIAYSTAPGEVALDGTGANSPFTAALASTLEGHRQDLRDVLKLVRAKVRLATGGAQTPWFIDNSSDAIIIQPREEIKLAESLRNSLFDTVSLETTAWNTISSSSDPNDFALFANLYPQHELADIAVRQLTTLRGAGQPELPMMDLGVPDPNPAVPNGLGTLITECDVLATPLGDVFGLVEPVPHDLVNTRAALRACIEAVSLDPNNPRLLSLLGRVLKLEERYVEARHYFERATEEGSSSAYGGLAELYRFGLGVDVDLERAANYLKEGALMGNAPIRQVLAGYYRQGWGVPQSFSEARRWLEISAMQGYPAALTALGDIHRRGQGVPADPALAIKYYRQAAATGKTDAMNNIGMAYMRGEGVETDTNLGIYWLSRASDVGNPYSAYHLGRAFRKGWGVEKDPVQAIAYFRLSAQRNFLGAYTQIADMLKGEGNLPSDYPRAYANYIIAIEAAKLRDTIASRKNQEEAEAKLAELQAGMTDAETAEGEQIAKEWITQYGLLDFTLVAQ